MTMPRIYTSSWTLFPSMNAVGAARFSAKEGFAGIELACDEPIEFWPTAVPDSTIAELAAIGDGEGIGYAIHAPDSLNPATSLPEGMARDDEIIKRLVDWAERLSSPVLGVHPGVVHTLFGLERHGVRFATERHDPLRLVEEARMRAVETLGRWAEMAAQAGLMLTVENEVHVRHTAAATAEILADMIAEMRRHDVGVNLDTGHAIIGGGLAEEFAVLKDRIVHFHLNDGKTHGVSEHLPLGEGRADFSVIADFMGTFGGILVLEIFAPDRPVRATLESRDYLLGVLARA